MKFGVRDLFAVTAILAIYGAGLSLLHQNFENAATQISWGHLTPSALVLVVFVIFRQITATILRSHATGTMLFECRSKQWHSHFFTVGLSVTYVLAILFNVIPHPIVVTPFFLIFLLMHYLYFIKTRFGLYENGVIYGHTFFKCSDYFFLLESTRRHVSIQPKVQLSVPRFPFFSAFNVYLPHNTISKVQKILTEKQSARENSLLVDKT